VTTATKVAIKPLEDRIVVQPSDAEQTTASGLVIPDTAKEKPAGSRTARACRSTSPSATP
jgi:co-chaperonin GroES (HSP10)